MCVQYIRGCSVHQGCSVHRGLPWAHQGDSMSTSLDVQYIRGIPGVYRAIFNTSEGYHEYIGDIMSTSADGQYIGDVQYIGVFNRNWKGFIKLLPNMYNDITLMYSLYPSNVLNIPQCTHDIPAMYSWDPPYVLNTPDVLNIPWCT